MDPDDVVMDWDLWPARVWLGWWWATYGRFVAELAASVSTAFTQMAAALQPVLQRLAESINAFVAQLPPPTRRERWTARTLAAFDHMKEMIR